MRTISATSSSPSTRSTAARVSPACDDFVMRKWAEACEATCGRCVMQTTCASEPSARSRAPTARAVLPPTPASTSSKTSVGEPAPAAKPVSASMTRESSPPEAASRSGEAGMPALVATMNSIRSAPVEVKPSGGGSTGISELPPPLPRCSPPGPALPGGPPGPLRQLLQLGLAFPGESLGALGAGVAERGGHVGALRGDGSGPLLGRLGEFRAVLEPLDPFAARIGVLEHRLDRAAVLSLQ